MVLVVLAMASHASADAKNLASIHTVAIVSAIGWSAGMQEQPGLAGNSEGDIAFVDMSARGIDDWIEHEVKSLLGPQLQVANIAFERARFFSINPQSAFDHYDQKLRSLVLAQYGASGADAIIVVHSRYVTTGGALSGPWLSGLGVQKSNSMFGVRPSSIAYAGYGVTVIDPRTGEILGDGLATVGAGWPRHGIPVADVAADEWTSDPNGLTDSAKERLEDTFQKLIVESLPNALKQANLISEITSQDTTTSENAHQ